VLGIIGLFLFIIGPILGIVFGIIALVQIRRRPPQRGKRLAITGIVLSCLWLVLIAALIPVALSTSSTPSGAPGSMTGSVNLAARMLQTSDLPAGFQPYKPLNGPLDAKRAAMLGGGLAGQAAGLLHGWVRDWVWGQTGRQVTEVALDAGTRGNASEGAATWASNARKHGAVRQRIAAHLYAFEQQGQLDNIPYTEIYVPIARGPFVFLLTVLAPTQPASAGVNLAAKLASVQERKVPANTPDTKTSLADLQADPYNAAGYAIGLLVGYLGIVSGIAYLRNPSRSARRGDRSLASLGQPGNAHVLDVSTLARAHRNAARWRLVVQLAGLSLIAIGADPWLVPNWYLFVLAGAAITWAGGRFIHPRGQRLARNRWVLSGARKTRVTVLMSLALVLVLAGAVLLIGYSLNQSLPPVVQAANAAASPPAQSIGYLWLGIILMACGAVISRRAHRLAALDAQRLMQRDTRPPVLYLRSFGDDALKLWTATLGRPSLLERLTPRRFDAFEEVIARHLSLTGPVIALNPPDIKLAPLGAARETLDSADWQATITSWMRQSAIIVIVVPPGKVTSGLTWELQQVSADQHWDKTLLLVPPLRADLLQSRWQAFLAAYGSLWPFTSPLPLATSWPLALTFNDGAWTTICAYRQNEWAYSAAIQEALGALRQPAVTGAPT
jgi:hypothetical protein